MSKKILIANRGEIICRIIKTARRTWAALMAKLGLVPMKAKEPLRACKVAAL